MAWHNKKKIVGVFVHPPQNRNVWINISDVGWKLLWTDHDCQSSTMAVMAAHARAENRDTDVEEENGQVKTLYVW